MNSAASETALLIESQPGEQRLAFCAGEAPTDLVVRGGATGASATGELGDIFFGRMGRAEPSLGAAFVEVGLSRPGFLPLTDLAGARPDQDKNEGAGLLVKVVRPAAPGKGVKLSCQLSKAERQVAEAAMEVAFKAPAKTVPTLLRPGFDPLEDFLARRPSSILVDDLDLYRSLKARLTAADPALAAGLRLESGGPGLFAAAGIEATLEELLLPEVALPSGGFLLVEPVRTLTAIDVDSARHALAGDSQSLALAVNLEAATEIARQLRLRQVSGLIVIDFLALRRPASRQTVVAALQAALADDPATTRVFPMAPSGLVEMTRQRRVAPLHEVLTCAAGEGGSGRVWRPERLAFAALRRLRAAQAAEPAKVLGLLAAPAVAAALKNGTAAAARAALEARLGRPIAVESDPQRLGTGEQSTGGQGTGEQISGESAYQILRP